MNKNRYRIVFNNARNLMMAVAENTSSQGKGQQSGSVRSNSRHPNVAETPLGTIVIELLQLKPIAFAALCMFGLQPVLLYAEVTADANAAANNRPLIETTANGLPLVQITAPSAAGVSRNQYSQFNVDPAGVILNNSQVNVLTQQGGYVNGNANLANGSARIILNEVTGTGASSLRGYTEVAGQRAEVIIANPNGIVCDGCGFINTSRGILTTGVPVMSGGNLDSFRVTGGQIQIGAGGLNTSNTDQLDLITRSLQVNGEIWANNLNAVIGANQVDYATLDVQVIQGDANKPTVGIDVALLGGMYANKIRLVGTEAGVGVNSLGNMAAQAGDFTLNSQGNIILNGHTGSSGNIAIISNGDISNGGTFEGATVTTSSNAFTNSGAVLADAIALNASSLNNQSAQAKIAANTSVNLTVSGDISNTGTVAGSTVTTTGKAFTNTGALLADLLKIDATSLSNQGADARIAGNTSVDLLISGDISNAGSVTGPAITTHSNAFTNSGAVLANTLALEAANLNNQGAQARIATNISANLTVSGNIENAGTLEGNAITAHSNAFNNSGAVLADVLTLDALSLNNQGAQAIMAGNTSLNLMVGGDIINTGTLIGSTVITHSEAFNNSGAVLADALTLNAAGLNNQNAQARIAANISANLMVGGDISNAGTLSGDSVTVSGNAFTNTGAVLSNTLTLNASILSNQGADAIISGNTSANLKVGGNIDNAGTVMGGTVIASGIAFNNTGALLADKLTLNASSLSNQGAQAMIVGNTSANLLVSGDIANTGTVKGGSVTTSGNAFTNTGAVLANALTLNATSLNNQGAGARIVGNNSANLSVSGDIVNDGTIMGGSITSNSNAFTNSGTGGVFGDVVTLNANSLLNQAATSIISGHTSLDLNIAGDINNVGTLDGNTVTAYSNTFNNTGGVFGNDVTLNAATLNNTGNAAVIATTHALNLIVSDTINNTDGATLYSLGDLNAGASSTLDADGYLSKNMVSFNNTSAMVQADGDLRISADQITNNRRLVNVDTTTTLPNVNTDVTTVTTVEHKIVSIVPNAVNPEGYLINGYAITVDIYTVAQVQGGTNVLSQTVTQTAETVTYKPNSYWAGEDYEYLLSAYNTITTPTITSTISCQSCYSTTVAIDSVNASTSARSNMLAGGNMHLKGSINNEYSTIAAGHDINFNANGPQTLTSGAYITPDPALTGVITTSANGYTQLSQVLISTESQLGTTDSWQWIVVGGHDECYPCHWQLDYGYTNLPLPYANTVTTLLDPSLQTLSASFTAGNNITGTAGYVNNHTTNANATTATLGAAQTGTSLGAVQANTQAANTATPPLNITLPTNGLYTYKTAPDQPYLIETNARFTSYHNFLTSDYMLSRLALDPQQIQKRLGDGFYEQKLVSDQVTGLTGRRFLPGYTSAEAEFKALMEQGIAEAHTQNLVPGVALTSAQVAALTHDIVWMVAQEVSLPDGTKEQLLVPQVFLTRLHENDLRPNGSLIAAENIDIKTSGTLLNSGTILGSKTTALSATDVINQSGTIGSGGDTVIVASNDIRNLSGTISGVRVAVLAGHDLVNETEMEAVQLGQVFTTRIHNTATIAATEKLDMHAGHDVTIAGAKVLSGGDATIAAGNNFTMSVQVAREIAGMYAAPAATNPDGTPNLDYALEQFTSGENGAPGRTSSQLNLTSQIQSGGNLTLSANNDISLTAAQISAQKNLTIAGQNITLNAAKDVRQTSFNDHFSVNKSSYDETVIGSTLNAGDNVTLVATRRQTNNGDEHGNVGEPGHNSSTDPADAKGTITLEGATIISKNGAIGLMADGNINIGSVDEKHESFEQRQTYSSGAFTSTERTERNQSWRTDAIGSQLSGDSIRITSGDSIGIVGSNIDADKDITLAAMNDINIAAATNTYGSEHYSHEKTSGWQVTDGFNITDKGPETTGKARTDGTNESYSRSGLSSRNGNLNILAGGNLIASGTDLAANKGELALTAGGTVALLAGQDTLTQESSTTTETNTNLLNKQVRKITDSYSSIASQGSTTQAQTIKISSGADILLQAAQLNAGEGGITLDAGRDISLLAAENSSTSKHTETLRTDGMAFRIDGSLDDTSDQKRDQKAERSKQTAQLAKLASAGDITSHSGRDTLIQASELEASGAIDLSAGNAATYNPDGSIKNEGSLGNLTFAAVKDTDYTAEEDKHNSMPWQSQSGSGHYTETLKLASIKAGKGLSANATGDIIVEIPELAPEPAASQPPATNADNNDGQEHQPAQDTKKLTPAEEAAQAAKAAADKKEHDRQRQEDHIQKLASQPGQAWIGQLSSLAKDKPDSVHLQQVAAAAKHWDYKSEGLTPEAAAVIVIVVTYFTAGTGSGVASTTGASATAATGSAAVGAAVTAGISTLASQAAVTLINNQGDVGKTLEELGKSENVRVVVAAMLTAGVAGSYGSTHNLERFSAQTLTGCVTGEMTGSGCEKGATTAAIMTGLEWGNREMRDAMKEDSKKFNGVSDTNDPSGKKYSNMTGEGSAGIDGDGTRLAGTRISRKELEKLGTVTDVTTDTWTFTGNNNPVTGERYTLTDALNKQVGPTGGSQALLPTFAGKSVERGGFLDKLQESYAGPHDYLGGNLEGGYDSLGNWGMAGDTADNVREVMAGVNIPLVTPFVIPTFLRQINFDPVAMGNIVHNGTKKP